MPLSNLASLSPNQFHDLPFEFTQFGKTIAIVSLLELTLQTVALSSEQRKMVMLCGCCAANGARQSVRYGGVKSGQQSGLGRRNAGTGSQCQLRRAQSTSPMIRWQCAEEPGTLRRLPQDARKHRRDLKSVYPQERVEVAQVMTDQGGHDPEGARRKVPIPTANDLTLPLSRVERTVQEWQINPPLFEPVIYGLETLSCFVRSQRKHKTPTLMASSTQSSTSPCSNRPPRRLRPLLAVFVCRSHVPGRWSE
jgi:hypothetical protein